MSRKFDRQYQINLKVREILEDPSALYYLGTKIIRKKPKYVPFFIWRILLRIVLAPSTREEKMAVTPQ